MGKGHEQRRRRAKNLDKNTSPNHRPRPANAPPTMQQAMDLAPPARVFATYGPVGSVYEPIAPPGPYASRSDGSSVARLTPSWPADLAATQSSILGKFPIGTHIPYTFVRDLAFSSAGQCTVRRAHNGVSLVSKHLAKPSPTRQRQPLEARLLLQDLRSHPNVITVVDAFSLSEAEVANGTGAAIFGAGPARTAAAGQYILMEYCSGGDLDAQMRHWARTPQGASRREMFVLHVIVGLAEALAYIHHGVRYVPRTGKYTVDDEHVSVMHVDLKPYNVFLRWAGAEGRVRGLPDVVLGDFGAASCVDGRDIEAKGNNFHFCTWAYSCPEVMALIGPWTTRLEEAPPELVARASFTASTAGDVYSFGHIVYMLLSKTRDPWVIGRDPRHVMVRRDWRTLPQAKRLAQWCLAVEPRDRPVAYPRDDGQGMMEIVEALRVERDGMVRESKIDPSDWAAPDPGSG